jgi:D-alanyl-D-alanine carboxypeptidase (penicillin-binding protein 5/6)
MKHIKFILLLFCICIIPSTCIGSSYNYIWSNLSDSTTSIEVSSDNSDILNLESTSAILIEQSTGKILYEHNSHEQLRPASVTKIMSVLLVMEALDRGELTLDTPIPCSEHARSMGGSQIWLDTTETLSVNDMLKAVLIVSANDCVVALGEYIAGSEEAFVQKMNDRAKELGMNDTTFKNCHGIDEDGHVTSAYDISIMSRELLVNHPNVTNYTTIYMDTLRDGKSQLVNTNKLLRTYDGCTGLKTGSTGLALYNLSASATRDDMSLIAVIMHAPSTSVRFSEAKKLLDYGFNNYSTISFGNTGDIVATLEIKKGTEKELNAVFNASASILIKKGLENSVIQNISVDSSIEAPISAGQKIGTATYSLNDEIIATIDIVAEKEIKKSSFLNLCSGLYKKWFNLLR